MRAATAAGAQDDSVLSSDRRAARRRGHLDAPDFITDYGNATRELRAWGVPLETTSTHADAKAVSEELIGRRGRVHVAVRGKPDEDTGWLELNRRVPGAVKLIEGA